MASTRPVRSVRTKAKETHTDLPYPEGPPNPQNPIEELLHSLDTGAYSPKQLARVDDFVIRTLFEHKHYRRKLRPTEAEKFNQAAPLPNHAAFDINKEWIKVSRDEPLHKWVSVAEALWDTHIKPKLQSGSAVGALLAEDSKLFACLMARYSLIYHAESPIKLSVVRFKGIEAPQRGVKASKPISKGQFILTAGGMVSKGSPAQAIAKFSIIQFQGKNTLLVGPIRFVNHDCRPNCEFWNTVDQHSDAGKASHNFYLRAIRDIAEGEDILLDYGRTYFGGSGAQCLCSQCAPPTPEEEAGAMAAKLKEQEKRPPNLAQGSGDAQTSLKRGKKPVYRCRKKLRMD